MERGEAGGKAGVLHAHLDADGAALGIGKAQQTSDEPAQAQAAEVVEHHHEDDDHATREQLLRVGPDDDSHNHRNGNRGDSREIINGLLRELWPKALYD